MKVLMLNGSSNINGNTCQSLEEIGKTLKEENIEYEIFQIGTSPIRDCIGCRKCTDDGCIFNDDNVNEFIKKAKECDGFVFGTPVYYAHPSGRILSFLDRVFYSNSKLFREKPGCVVAVARRGGTTASCDVLSKYFGISGMIQVGSTYWNVTHGAIPGEVQKDEEGLQTMRNAGRNLAWLMKCIELGDKNKIERPNLERNYKTNFIK